MASPGNPNRGATLALLAFLLALLVGVRLEAGEESAPPPPASVEAAARAVLAALDAKDDAALRGLASRSDPDPWLVADDLVRRGALDAAETFAKAGRGADLERLPGYLAGRRGGEDDPARRDLLRSAQATLSSGQFAEVLEALGTPPAGPIADVTGVRLLHVRGLALANLGRLAEASAAFTAAADVAESLGWWPRAAQALDLAVRTALDAGESKAAVGLFERLRAVAARRGDQRGEAMALSGLAFAQGRLGASEAALDMLERALAIWVALGDPAGIAAAHFDLGMRLVDVQQPERAAPHLEQAVKGFQVAGDKAAQAAALVQLGEACVRAGDEARALAHWDQAVALFESLGDKQGAAGALLGIGQLYVEGRSRDDAKALPVLQKAVALARAAGDREAEVLAVGRLGNLHAQRIERAEARRMYERQIELTEQQGDERQLAAVLIDAGRRFCEGLMLDASVARSWLERGLPLAEKAGEPRWVANAWLHLGDLERALGRLPESRAACERGLEVATAAGLRESEAGALIGIGRALFQQQDAEAALEAYERALVLFEAGGNRGGQAATLEMIGRTHALRGRLAPAVGAFQKALDLAKTLDDVHLTAALLRGLAEIHLEFGDAQKAVSLLEQALKLAEQRNHRQGQAEVLLSLGVALRQLGAMARALDSTERARALQLAMGDRRGAAMTLCNIGVVYSDLGQVERALGLFQEARSVFEAIDDRVHLATTLSNIGLIHERLGDPQRGLEHLERSLVLWEGLEDAVGAARVRQGMGECAEALGDLARAQSLTEQALAAYEAAGDKRAIAGGQLRLGELLLKAGQGPKAVALLERAARAAEKLGSLALQVPALTRLAEARLAAGDAGRAVGDAHRAVDLFKSLVSGLGEEQGSSARGEFTPLFAVGLRAAAALDDLAEATFFLESGRAGALLEALGTRGTMRWSGMPEELRHAEADARAEVARALAAWNQAADGPDRAAARERKAEHEAAQARHAAVVERIQREAKKESRMAYPVATPVEDIQALLGEGEALVLYGLAKAAEPAFALVLTRAQGRLVELGPTTALLEAAEALDARRPGTEVAPALLRLRALLLEPLALPQGTRRLLVSPDGALGYVPFAALAPDLELGFVASGSTYGVLREERGEPGTRVLALGDPDYEVKFDPTALELYGPRSAPAEAAVPEAAEGTRGRKLVALPNTRAEALAVGEVALLGKDASEAGLLAALGGARGPWKAVHFACHGLVNPDRPSVSSLALTPDPENDGFLTLLEVLRMDLRANLVVLSACETGKGKIAGGEGIVGLTRAFMFAGSPSVLCSLWKVDDESTAALMKRFYEVWRPKDGSPGKPPAAALREAQAFVRAQERWKHPYYWAAWVLWGLPD